MPQSRSKYEFYKEASLSQQLAHRMPEYSEYAGSDPRTSKTLARFRIFEQHGILDFKNNAGLRLIRDLLNEQRKALFATSEKVNEITKMGLQMPKAEDEFGGTGD